MRGGHNSKAFLPWNRVSYCVLRGPLTQYEVRNVLKSISLAFMTNPQLDIPVGQPVKRVVALVDEPRQVAVEVAQFAVQRRDIEVEHDALLVDSAGLQRGILDPVEFEDEILAPPAARRSPCGWPDRPTRTVGSRLSLFCDQFVVETQRAAPHKVEGVIDGDRANDQHHREGKLDQDQPPAQAGAARGGRKKAPLKGYRPRKSTLFYLSLTYAFSSVSQIKN